MAFPTEAVESINAFYGETEKDMTKSFSKTTAKASLAAFGKLLTTGILIGSFLVMPSSIARDIVSFTACDENTGRGGLVFAWPDNTPPATISGVWYDSITWPCEEADIWERYYNRMIRIKLDYEMCIAQAEGRYIATKNAEIDSLNKCLANTGVDFLVCLGGPLVTGAIDVVRDWRNSAPSPAEPEQLEFDFGEEEEEQLELFDESEVESSPPAPPAQDSGGGSGFPSFLTRGLTATCLALAIKSEIVCYYSYNSDLNVAENTLENDKRICQANRTRDEGIAEQTAYRTRFGTN